MNVQTLKPKHVAYVWLPETRQVVPARKRVIKSPLRGHKRGNQLYFIGR